MMDILNDYIILIIIAAFILTLIVLIAEFRFYIKSWISTYKLWKRKKELKKKNENK